MIRGQIPQRCEDSQQRCQSTVPLLLFRGFMLRVNAAYTDSRHTGAVGNSLDGITTDPVGGLNAGCPSELRAADAT